MRPGLVSCESGAIGGRGGECTLGVKTTDGVRRRSAVKVAGVEDTYMPYTVKKRANVGKLGLSVDERE